MLFSIWLVPSNPCFLLLHQQIQKLSSTYDAPLFLPHMTIFTGKTENIDMTKKLLSSVITEFSHLEAKVEGIESSEAFYKTLFIKLTNNKILSGMHARLSSLDTNSNYEFHPHMSLMYKKLPFNIKEKIIQGMGEALEFEKVSFDKVQIMTDSHDETRKAVENWKIIEVYNIR